MAVELCNSAVIPKPVAKARKRLRVELLSIARMVPPNVLVMLVVTNRVLQSKSATAAMRWIRIMVILFSLGVPVSESPILREN